MHCYIFLLYILSAYKHILLKRRQEYATNQKSYYMFSNSYCSSKHCRFS